MENSYENYLNLPLSLRFDEMNDIYKQMTSQIGDDEDAIEIFADLTCAAVEYANIRAQCSIWDSKTCADNDSYRTALHNKMITYFNMLARVLKSEGKNTSWREALGDENADALVRKRIGDFGCFIVFVNSLNAR